MKNVIEEYLATSREPERTTFEVVRATIHELVPNLQECISYGIPAFRTPRGVVAGLAINKKFCSYYPFSGSVLDAVAEQINEYSRTKSALHFAHNEPLPPAIVKVLIESRLGELDKH